MCKVIVFQCNKVDLVFEFLTYF